MNKNLSKQILFGGGYLIVLFVIIFIIYSFWFKASPTCFDNRQNQGETGIDCGGPCLPCEIKTLVPLEASRTKYFSADGQTIILAEITNVNLNWAADSFNYSFDIYGENNLKLKKITNKSFIYSGEIKYIFEPTEIEFEKIKNIIVSFSDINWKESNNFPKPNIQTRGIKTEPANDNGTGAIVSGFINNNNPFGISKVRIIGILLNQNNIQLSASKTEIENIPAFGEKSFKINFPKSVSLIKTEPDWSYVFTSNLELGSNGEEVKKLEEFLQKQGFLSGTPTGYFNTSVKNALIEYQKKEGLLPASGYFGIETREHINLLTQEIPKADLSQSDPNKTKIYIETIR
ncbi:peptidoglycan-binding protein [Candidatus Wolfebacteria bacterium]|nr:peptidoglycan-binding protein [Candidatus Wolfebacteria bacterium]